METEAKAKVVAFVWEKNWLNSLPCNSCFALDDLNYRMNCTKMIWKKRMNSSYSSKSSQAKQLVRQRIGWILPLKQKWRPLPFLLSLSFFYANTHLVILDRVRQYGVESPNEDCSECRRITPCNMEWFKTTHWTNQPTNQWLRFWDRVLNMSGRITQNQLRMD